MIEQESAGTVVVATVPDLTTVLSQTAGRSRAVVMTMGALHEGHLALVQRARELADQVVVTVFVNPLQFGPGEDLDRYPRRLDADVTMLSAAGADVVFAPEAAEVYPGGTPRVQVSAGALGRVLEGAVRPGHFDGMLTVVLKLLHMIRPTWAVFGEKDAQQLVLVRRMVQDLDVPVEIVGVPTVRDSDGLALSSRNAHLSSEERTHALVLSRALVAAGAEAAAGAGGAEVLAAARALLAQEREVVPDYAALVDPATLAPWEADQRGPALLLVAARVGRTRLIDNAGVVLRGPGTEAVGRPDSTALAVLSEGAK